MKKSGLTKAFALAAVFIFGGALGYHAGAATRPASSTVNDSAESATASCAGTVMPDGTVRAGFSPLTGTSLFTTLADAPGTYTEPEGDAFCRSSNANGHNDWRMPLKDELNVLWENRDKGRLYGTFNETGSYPAGWYWSSSPDGSHEWTQRFSDGSQDGSFKNSTSSLRCVR